MVNRREPRKMAKVGRPTKYSDEIITKTRDYIDNFANCGDVIPSVAGLSIILKISRDTVYDWASQEDKKEFSYTLGELLAKQEQILINKGLTSEFNSNIVKLALGNHHSYKERQDITTNDKEIDSKFTVEVVSAKPTDT